MTEQQVKEILTPILIDDGYTLAGVQFMLEEATFEIKLGYVDVTWEKDNKETFKIVNKPTLVSIG
jgi:hypothetical protein